MSILKDLVGGVAPAIAGALLGKDAKAAVKSVSRAIFGREDASEDECAAELRDASPEKWAEYRLKLRDQDATFELEQQRIEAADRANARAREIAVKDRIPGVLAISITVGFFGILGYLLFGSPPPSNERVLDIMLGALGGAWLTVVGYYFGSSRGSAAKDLTIRKTLDQR